MHLWEGPRDDDRKEAPRPILLASRPHSQHSFGSAVVASSNRQRNDGPIGWSETEYISFPLRNDGISFENNSSHVSVHFDANKADARTTIALPHASHATWETRVNTQNLAMIV